MLHVVVMAGGEGTRLWPMSGSGQAKHLFSLDGKTTLLEDTVRRALRFAPARGVWVVTVASQAAATRKALRHFRGVHLLAEPVGRNSAAAACAATLYLEARARKPVTILLFPADHRIPIGRRFLSAIRAGTRRAAEGKSLVTFGLSIGSPRTDFGYIELGKRAGTGVRKAERFVEKPTAARAKRMFRSRRFVWNSGIFAWRSDLFRAEMQRWAPGVHRPIASALQRGWPKTRRNYVRARNLSIDYALLEKSKRVEVVPSNFPWSDVGTWSAVFDALSGGQRDANVTLGRARVVEGKENLAFASEREAILFGVRDLVVVDTPKALLVTTREKSTELKALLSRIQSGRRLFQANRR